VTAQLQGALGVLVQPGFELPVGDEAEVAGHEAIDLGVRELLATQERANVGEDVALDRRGILAGLAGPLGPLAIGVDVVNDEAIRIGELRGDVAVEEPKVAVLRVLELVGSQDGARVLIARFEVDAVGLATRVQVTKEFFDQPLDRLAGSCAAVLGQDEDRENRLAHHRPRMMRMSPGLSMPVW
jgi:hypothetical protein